MKPKFYTLKTSRHWDVDWVLKLLLLACILLTSTSIIYGQDYFYYYNGEKKELKLNTEYIYLVTSAEINDSTQLKDQLDRRVIVQKFSFDSPSQALKAVSQSGTGTNYWAEVRLTEKMSAESYLKYLKQLEQSGSIKNASPYFTANGDKVGLSQYFYVKLKNEKDFSRLEKMAAEAGAEIVGQNKFMPLWYTLKCGEDSKLNALEYANQFYESGLFEHAEPDLMVENLAHSSNDPFITDQWGLANTGQYGGTAGTDIRAFNAWDITKGSRDVIVAVVDHGFEMNHPDLEGNTFGTGFNTGTGTSPAQVLGSHGTACAGIIGAIQDNNRGVSGVAPNAQLMSVSNALVLSPTATQELADGINWAWQNGADVISNSWGHNSLASALIDNAITNALTNGRSGLGTIVVFSAGNGNSSVKYPANSNPDIIAVGAMSPCGERKSPSSCDGETTWGSDFGATLDVVAPGVLISTTDRQGAADYNPGIPIHPWNNGTAVATDYPNQDYTVWFNGTSSACPMVAGVAALVLSVNPCLTHDEVEDIIEQSAQKVGGYAYANTMGRPNGTWHNEMGYGLVDAEAAVQLAQQSLPAGNEFDLYSKDRPFDTGVEPNPDGGPMWISEDIWVRQNLDGGLTHENPEYKMFSPNGVYVRVRNNSSVTSECANLSLYFSKASTGLVWPNHWINYTLSGVLNGDKVNTVSVPPIPPGGTTIVEIPWYPPNPGDFVNDIHHFCLLARIESPADPMFNEQNGVGVSINVKNNNNIVWKNVQVYNNDISDFTSLYIRGVQRGWSRINLRFYDRGFKDRIEKPFFDRGGEIYVKVEPEFFERIKKAELQDIKIIDENTLFIASPKATIYGIEISDKETFSMHFAFRVEVGEKEEVLLDVLQQNTEKRTLEGGERFIITKSAKAQFLSEKLVVDKANLVYPNPAKDEIYIKYNVDSDNSPVEVSVYDVLDPNHEVQLYKGEHNRGEYFEWYNIQNLKKGVYVLKLKIGDEVKTERIVVSK